MEMPRSRGGTRPYSFLFFFFLFGRFLNRHVVEFFGIENVATFQAFNIFGVFVSGNDSNLWVFAGGNHCLIWLVLMLLPQIVATFCLF
jgi:hypothetical protein